MGSRLSRRGFLRASAASGALRWLGFKGIAVEAGAPDAAAVDSKRQLNRLFAADLKGAQWNTFQAAGYAKEVSGICYRTKSAGYFSCYVDRPVSVSGMPLGGIDTGALYLEPSGVLGYTSIFNHLTPIGGPLNVPYMGLRQRRQGHGRLRDWHRQRIMPGTTARRWG